MKRESILCGKCLCPALLLIFILCIYPVKTCASERAAVISNVLNQTLNVKPRTRSSHNIEHESRHVNQMKPEAEALKKMIFEPVLFTALGYNNARSLRRAIFDVAK